MHSLKMVGKKYNKLTVKKAYKIGKQFYADCLCDCGKEKSIRTTSIKQGLIKSCGCLNSTLSRERCYRKAQNLGNKKFGHWTVLFQKGDTGKSKWMCKCDCGTRREVFSVNLIRGLSKSCGCIHASPPNKLPFGVSAFNNLYQKYRTAAKRRSLEFNLPKELFKSLINGNCYYCGKIPVQCLETNAGSFIIYNGIDRINNSVGYIKTNVVSCCKKCNLVKGALPFDEFRDWIINVYNRIGISNDKL